MNILELSQTRFSARKYTDEAVSDDDLAYILECARLAPSAVNRQPWKFVVVRSKEAKEQLWQAYDRDWFRTAPLYIVCMKNNSECWTRRYDDKQHGDIDVAIATEHLCLAATERNLGTCWVCNFDTDAMVSSFRLTTSRLWQSSPSDISQRIVRAQRRSVRLSKRLLKKSDSSRTARYNKIHNKTNILNLVKIPLVQNVCFFILVYG